MHSLFGDLPTGSNLFATPTLIMHVLYWSLKIVQWMVQILVAPTSLFPADVEEGRATLCLRVSALI